MNQDVNEFLKTLRDKTNSELLEIQNTAGSSIDAIKDKTNRKIADLESKTGSIEILQEMIESISIEHDARFEVVPLKYAGDNGVMIGWAGILRYKEEKGHDISKTIIKPKERMDQITIPWRS